jgi:hypothetical protein
VAGLRAQLLADREQEGSAFVSNRRCRNRGLLAIGNKPTIAGAQPDLCLPGDAANAERKTRELAPARSRRTAPKIGMSRPPRSAGVVLDNYRSW